MVRLRLIERSWCLRFRCSSHVAPGQPLTLQIHHAHLSGDEDGALPEFCYVMECLQESTSLLPRRVFGVKLMFQKKLMAHV